MKEYEVVYEENKKLDDMFDKLYDNNSKDTIEKNILELLVEIGELANETRCFKYWSNKKPSNKDEILDEYADCMLMTLYFCNMVNLDLSEPFDEVECEDIIYQFKNLYYLGSQLTYELKKDLIKEILTNMIHLGILLSFSKTDIIDGCLLKIEKNKTRFNTGF